uniref:Head fiber protein n=1 Tax=CrAss-like virus sp. ctXt06 TaxID=2825837 RepID=A0A8S5V6U1_9CAUD|nr:MAG TPA: Head fiber protein [CrAss-like virus sp. ctXt06]
MDIDKIYNALQSLPLPIEQKTLLIEAFTSGEPKVQQPEVPQQEDTRIEDLTKEVEQLKESVEKLTEKLNEIVLPVRATKDDEGLVRAISNIKNLEVSTATIPTIVGAFNTLLLNLRSAGIIQM